MKAWKHDDDQGYARLLGFRLVLMELDHVIVEFDAGPEHANPMGTLHGGAMCSIADSAMGLSWSSGLKENETCTTVELKINFLRPHVSGRMTAEGRVLRRGRTMGYVECDLRDEHGRLIARASSTCMTLRGEQAVGR